MGLRKAMEVELDEYKEPRLGDTEYTVTWTHKKCASNQFVFTEDGDMWCTFCSDFSPIGEDISIPERRKLLDALEEPDE